jgi:Putative transposase
LLPVRVLSELFRGLMLDKLLAVHAAGRLQFFGNHSALTQDKAFRTYLAPLRRRKWHVYAKPPFGGPEAVLAYLSRYTHRVAISNSRLIGFDRNGVTFKYKDYRADGSARYKRMTLTPHEFIRRFLIHVLPKGFHRIRHFGLFAKSSCPDNIARARELLAAAKPQAQHADADATDREPATPMRPCPCCGGHMIIIETFARGSTPRHRPTATVIRNDTS